MLKQAIFGRSFSAWRPATAGPYPAGLTWLLALGWWLLLGLPLRRSLRPALGGATAGSSPAGPPTRPRRPKAAPRRFPRQAYPSAA